MKALHNLQSVSLIMLNLLKRFNTENKPDLFYMTAQKAKKEEHSSFSTLITVNETLFGNQITSITRIVFTTTTNNFGYIVHVSNTQ